jgi:hypothetical protein
MVRSGIPIQFYGEPGCHAQVERDYADSGVAVAAFAMAAHAQQANTPNQLNSPILIAWWRAGRRFPRA